MTARVRARLAEWFDVMRPGLAIDGSTHKTFSVTEEDCAQLVLRSPCPLPVFDDHDFCRTRGELQPNQVGRIGQLRWARSEGGIQARMDMIAPKFVNALAQGVYFGRSLTIRDGRIIGMAFSGPNAMPGSAGNRPLHFIDRAAFPTEDDWKHNLHVIEHQWTAWADGHRERHTGGKAGRDWPEEGSGAFFSWVPPADYNFAGIIIRYAPDPDPEDVENWVDWGVMDPLHLGVLTSSPYETTNPPKGDWQFAARALSTDGELSEIVYFKATLPEGLLDIASLTQREFVFARTATPDPIRASQRPQDSWPYDQPGTADGLTWTDGQKGLTPDLPVAWQSSRAVPIGTSEGDAVEDPFNAPVVVALRGATPEDGVDGQGYEFIFAKTSTAAAPAAPSNDWGYDAPESPWFDGAPTLSIGDYLWMAQRRVAGTPAVGDAVAAQWTSPRSISRAARDGEDSTVPGPPGRPGPIGPPGPRVWQQWNSFDASAVSGKEFLYVVASALSGNNKRLYGGATIDVSSLPGECSVFEGLSLNVSASGGITYNYWDGYSDADIHEYWTVDAP
ncbi:MAG: hypothetical protein OXH76_18685 [Boseongicola sp.]|nr:hypothetical protein [Boseongicola sp.]